MSITKSLAKKAFAKVKKKSVNKWKKDAWDAFSRWVRTKYADEFGMLTCYTCGVVKHYKEMHAGHGLSGRGNSILFEPKIIRPQCPRCNLCVKWGLCGNYDVFHVKLEEEHGKGFIKKMLKQKQQTKQFTVQELQDLIKKYS